MSPEPVTGGDSALETALLAENREEYHVEDRQLSTDLMEVESPRWCKPPARAVRSHSAPSRTGPMTGLTTEWCGMAYAVRQVPQNRPQPEDSPGLR